jgi:hypothetical protein
MPALTTTRRGALQSAAAAFGAAGAARAATSVAKIPIRFDDPIWNRETAARLQADTTGRQVYGRCTGIVCGVRPGEAVRPLFKFEVFSTIRVLRQHDGSYQRMTKETIFYTDPKTGDILDTWLNPYTNETVHVVDVANDPYNWIIAATVQPPAMPGIITTGQAVPGGKPYLLHWSDFGADNVLLTEDGHAYYKSLLDPKIWKRESAGPMIQTSELFRYVIKRADMENPALTHLPHVGSWVRVQPWLPWMLMGQAPGHVMYDGIFSSSLELNNVSPQVLARVKAKYPGYLTAPTKWYGPNYSSLEHYAREQKPAPEKL